MAERQGRAWREGVDGAERAGPQHRLSPEALAALLPRLQAWAHELGFSQIGVADVDLGQAEPGLQAWLAAGCHGGMAYMARHGLKRARPAELVPGTLRVITARMDYLPATQPAGWQAIAFDRLADARQAVVSLYAQGRDYHKVLRQRLQALADRLQQAVGPFGHRVFTDSAPVLEVELAARSGLGWRGKHTLALSRDGGSMFFLGEIYVDLPLPVTAPMDAHCGACTACIVACPTGAIVAPYRLDARRCLSYLTIEHDGPIPLEFRAALGNRIYGCDDCQLVCPWNKFARQSPLPDFDTRAQLGRASLLQLWAWDAATFLRHTEGSAIRRIGFARWRRNLAVALGNAWRATGDAALAQALGDGQTGADALLAEHIGWALAQRSAPLPQDEADGRA
jgi:epoxyqueuosine reductase